MALEKVYECPRTLAKHREKPLGAVVEGFCEWLRELRFSRHSIQIHLRSISHVNRYLGQLGMADPSSLSVRHFEDFLRDYPRWCRARISPEYLRQIEWSLHRFTEYLVFRGVLCRAKTPGIYDSLLEEYLDWMRDFQHSAPGTLEVRRNSLVQFFEWLGPEATAAGISKLSAESVEAFSLSFAKRIGRPARRSMQSALRTFFRFCLHRGYITDRLDRAVPRLRTYKLATLPRGFTDDQAQKVLEQVDRESDVGRRDYAILLLLYTYGVRGAQVRGFRLEDIDWEENRILFRASKSGKDSLLPLTQAVGESLLSYLKKSPPQSLCPEVFLTSQAPYRPLRRSSNVSVIVGSYIRSAGIELASHVGHGAHAFRHCFATRMLAEGHSLKAIADVIGHRHLQTTFIYTKVDFKSLGQVGLEWPEGV